MTRHRLILAVLLIAAAALSARASAQQPSGADRGIVFGLGGGLSRVRDARTGEQAAGPALYLSAGYRLGRATPTVEVVGHRMFDESLPLRQAATDRVLKTSALLASVQVELPGAFYLRPGVGLGDHAFVDPDRAPGDDGTPYTRHESGSAAGLALGRAVIVARTIPIAIEGAALWTGGGGHTGDRLSVGVQLVALLRF